MRLARAGCALGFFLLVFGAKLWVIGAFGSPVPFWDQWGNEAQRVYKPLQEGRFGPLDVFQRANVHHIAWSRTLDVVLLRANGAQWDPRVQQIVQGALHAAFMTILAVAVSRRLGHGARFVSLALLGVYLVFPYGWGNTLWGYEKHFYFLVFWSPLALFGLAPYTPRAPAWWLGLAAAAFALFSAASGFLAGTAAAVTALGLAIGRRRPWRAVAPTLIAGIVLTGLGAWMTQYEDTMAGGRFGNFRSEAEAAPSLLERGAALVTAAGHCLGWPLDRPGLAGWLMAVPIAIFLLRWLLEGRKAARTGEPLRADAAETLLAALGAWALLQAIGISALRGGEVATRHRDVLIFNVWMNALALLWLLRGPGSARLARRVRIALTAGAALWVAAVASGLAFSAQRVWNHELPEWRQQTADQRENVQRFLATDDPSHFEGKPYFSVPHPRHELLVELLRDPTVRGVLPPVLRDPLPLRPDPADAPSAGWAAGAVPPPLGPPAPGLPIMSSYGTGEHRFRSEPVRTEASALEFAIAGSGSGARLLLVDAGDGTRRREIALPALSEQSWRPVSVPVPGGGGMFRIEATAPEAPPEGWLAVAAPKEVGRLGRWLVPLTEPRAAGGIALAGIALAGFGLAAGRLSARGGTRALRSS